ncbi:excinuclease ABC subunit UvrA [Megasphaera paucivorans]|uniref:UvrABC system protein A n=1 Tax=Megasphaera paucivorans TaxID=349095 RepID=A0A1G9Q8G2_9FIRM|nr:excinuclease ABC subunit UvrA [Megasphaera paucivorans]SDM07240.1 excinuclease ABC subunit A [Megasphaera paucivorans]
MSDAYITIKGARQHNLKNISVKIPRDKLVVFTGLSGSGKSSLAFDTIYAEGQRRYVESLSAYARQFLGQMDKPDVDYIEGLSPAISIDQKTTSRNPRSTVGTVTEIYDYLRLLYARAGEAFCPQCGKPIRQQSVEQMSDAIMALGEGEKIMVMAPVVEGRKGTHQKILASLVKEGYVRVRVDGSVYLLSDDIPVDKNKKHTIEVIVDRLVIKTDIISRLTDSLETACKLSSGIVHILRVVNNEILTYSQHFACPDCHISLPEIEPHLFSFNSPFGACPACTGIGSTMEVDEKLVIPDKNIPFVDGGVAALSSNPNSWFLRQLGGLLQPKGYTLDNCFNDLPKDLQEALLYGSEDLCTFEYENMHGEIKTFTTHFEGIVPMIRRRHREASSDMMRDQFEQFMTIKPCTTCHGARLRPEALAIKIGGLNIHELTEYTVADMIRFFDEVQLSDKQQLIARQILKEIKARLEFLRTVGLEYLTLSRTAGTLSGGEAQRIRLATQIGSGLVGVLYILDEPSIGLHQRDNDKLLDALRNLRDLGNTLIVVEHDEDTMRTADYILDIGPEAGEKGGRIVAQGTAEDIMACTESLTGQYLKGTKFIPLPEKRRAGNGNFIDVIGAAEHNLKNINVSFPVGTLTVVTGVSGSGKSTLVNEILYKGMAEAVYGTPHRPGEFKAIQGTEYIDKIINIDQSPIGRTPRSNPATYTGVFDFIRQLYSQTAEAKIRGYKSGRFSFNVKGGRCEACRGDGIIRIEMNFLPDVYVPCEVCHGARYNRETLEVKYKGKNISQVLDMTVDEGVDFFANIPRIGRKLQTLQDVGLGYIRLGQPATTLSGGEAQRVKLATELSKRSTGRTLYILDEPTTGLHTADIHKLMDVLQLLVDGGDTVVVIEHNLDVIKVADYIIDLGPEGGYGGGTVVATGTPEDICKVKKSYTGQFLKPVLERTRKLMAKGR